MNEGREQVRLEEEAPGGRLDPQLSPDPAQLPRERALGVERSDVLDHRVRECDVEALVGEIELCPRTLDQLVAAIPVVDLREHGVDQRDREARVDLLPVVGRTADVEHRSLLRRLEGLDEPLHAAAAKPPNQETVDAVDVHGSASASDGAAAGADA